MSDFIASFKDMDVSRQLLYVAGGTVVTIVSALALRKLTTSKEVRKIYPRDTVVLHQIGRGPYAPSMTPYAVKMETYLRMAKILYENVHDFTPSSKGKFPWIEYNGEAIADSSICIDFLNNKLGIDLNKHLNSVDKGIAQFIQTTAEEHLYWCLVLFRWQYDNDKTMMMKAFGFGKFTLWLIKRQIKKVTWAQGMGRHTPEEVTIMMKKDLQALSDFLGSKPYLFGTEPSEVDCSLFGMLSNIHWQFQGTGLETLLKDEYPNLVAYCERMKTRFWPDWDECITHGGTREATK